MGSNPIMWGSSSCVAQLVEHVKSKKHILLLPIGVAVAQGSLKPLVFVRLEYRQLNYRSKVLWQHVSLQNCTVWVRILVLLLKDSDSNSIVCPAIFRDCSSDRALWLIREVTKNRILHLFKIQLNSNLTNGKYIVIKSNVSRFKSYKLTTVKAFKRRKKPVSCWISSPW